jgi:hypothetical protein
MFVAQVVSVKLEPQVNRTVLQVHSTLTLKEKLKMIVKLVPLDIIVLERAYPLLLVYVKKGIIVQLDQMFFKIHKIFKI